MRSGLVEVANGCEPRIAVNDGINNGGMNNRAAEMRAET
ncbi:hypothetical protein O59_004188 [Cellvibrio sp. BR]|nr:hypothetical protein O59_004188 [Cellvibrio sp. BR]